LRNVLSRTGQYYCKKREKKERKQEAKREREVQRAEKIRLYSAQAAAKKLNGSSSGGAMGDGSGIYYCGTAGEELIGVVLSDEDEREASLNASVGDACVDASKDDDDEDEEEKSDNREEDKVHNMLPIISHLGFKRVWNAFTTPEDFELLPYGSLEYLSPPPICLPPLLLVFALKRCWPWNLNILSVTCAVALHTTSCDASSPPWRRWWDSFTQPHRSTRRGQTRSGWTA
jgi:hypothetical protein